MVVGAAALVLMSISFWYGETHLVGETGAMAMLTLYLTWAGMTGIIAGTMIGIIASGIPHSGNMSIMIIAATIVNFAVYSLATRAIIRVSRAVGRRMSTNL